MDERSKKGGTSLATGLTVLLILLVAVGAYVGGYFALSTQERIMAPLQKIGEPRREYIRARVFTHYWQARLFAPAARVESLIRGEPVETSSYKPASGT